MCGRIAQAHTPDELQELIGIQVAPRKLDGIHTSYNVPPSALLATLVCNASDIGWEALRWGFRPPWMTKRRPMINARSETVCEKPMFRKAIRRRRCVVVAGAWYEWLAGAGGKQPYCIRTLSGEPLLMAGIYDHGTCAILTRHARDDLAYIHNRMPVVMPMDMMDRYLGDHNALERVAAAAESVPLQAYAVTRRVGSPRYNGPECMTPLAA